MRIKYRIAAVCLSSAQCRYSQIWRRFIFKYTSPAVEPTHVLNGKPDGAEILTASRPLMRHGSWKAVGVGKRQLDLSDVTSTRSLKQIPITISLFNATLSL